MNTPGSATPTPHSTLDVRPVEPKDRFATIMGAYDALPLTGTLQLTVDHDPKCMYYTLRAMQGEECFRFVYLEEGPEVWRVEVSKLRSGTAAAVSAPAL